MLWNNNSNLASVPKYVGLGSVVAVFATNVGAGYTVAPTLTFNTPPSGVAAIATCTINASGQVSGITLSNPGSGYTQQNPPVVTVTAAPSGGGVTAVLHASFKEINKHILPDNASMVFVPVATAQSAASKAVGIRTPGWNLVFTYVDGNGRTRHRVEPYTTQNVV
jgi:hypothetical protein